MIASVIFDPKYSYLFRRGCTINGEYNVNLLRELRNAIKTKRPTDECGCVSYIRRQVRDCGVELVDHPPHYHDLTNICSKNYKKKSLIVNQFCIYVHLISAVDDILINRMNWSSFHGEMSVYLEITDAVINKKNCN